MKIQARAMGSNGPRTEIEVESIQTVDGFEWVKISGQLMTPLYFPATETQQLIAALELCRATGNARMLGVSQ